MALNRIYGKGKVSEKRDEPADLPVPNKIPAVKLALNEPILISNAEMPAPVSTPAVATVAPPAFSSLDVEKLLVAKLNWDEVCGS